MLLFCYYDIVLNSMQQFMHGKRIPLLSPKYRANLATRTITDSNNERLHSAEQLNC